jgi:hypothetical protein
MGAEARVTSALPTEAPVEPGPIIWKSSAAVAEKDLELEAGAEVFTDVISNRSRVTVDSQGGKSSTTPAPVPVRRIAAA